MREENKNKNMKLLLKRDTPYPIIASNKGFYRELKLLIVVLSEMYNKCKENQLKGELSKSGQILLRAIEESRADLDVQTENYICLDWISLADPEIPVEKEIGKTLEKLKTIANNMSSPEDNITRALENFETDTASSRALKEQMTKMLKGQKYMVNCLLFKLNTLSDEIAAKNAKFAKVSFLINLSTNFSKAMHSITSYLGTQIKKFMTVCYRVVSSSLKTLYNTSCTIIASIKSMFSSKKQAMRPTPPVSPSTLRPTRLVCTPEDSGNDSDCASDFEDNSSTTKTLAGRFN